MSRTVNKTELIGYIGKDIELRYTDDGQAVCNASLCTNEPVKKGGEWDTRPEWHRLVVWGKKAEGFGKWYKKGSYIRIEGSLQTRKWEDKEGNTRYTTEIKVRDHFSLERKGDNGGSQGDAPPHPADTYNKKGDAPTHTGKQKQENDYPPPPSNGDDEDEIPF